MHSVVAVLLRLVRLPLDIIFLSVDVLRIAASVVRRGLFRRFLGYADSTGLGTWCRAKTSEKEAAERARACLVAGKYGNPEFVRLICKCLIRRVSAEGRVIYACDGRRSHRSLWSAVPVLFTALALAVGWYLVFVGVQAALPRIARVIGLRRGDGEGHVTRRAAGSAEARLHIDQGQVFAGEGRFLHARDEFVQAARLDPSNADAHAGVGACALALGEPAAARRAFGRALTLDPQRASAYVRLGEIDLAASDAASALRHARKACELAPASVDANLLLSRCCLQLGNVTSALEAVQVAIDLAPTNAASFVVLGDLERSRRCPDAAERHYREALRLSSALIDARIGIARIAADRGNSGQAVEMLRGILTETRAAPAAVEVLSDLYVSRGEPVKAIDLCQSAVLDDPGLFGVRARLASLYIHVGDTDRGYRTASDLLDDHPGDVSATVVLANLFLDRGFTGFAQDICRRALARNEHQVRVRKVLAKACVKQRAMVEALKELEVIAEALPNDLETQLNLGLCHRALDRIEEARACLEAAARSHPASSLPHLQLAGLHLQCKEVDRAIEVYRTALELEPKSLVAMNNLGALLLKHKGAVDEAHALLTRAWSLYPYEPELAVSLGWALFRRAEHKRARDLLAYAQRRIPSNPTICYYLAEVLYADEKLSAAGNYARKALALSDDFEEAEHAEALLAKVESRLRKSATTGTLMPVQQE